VLFVSFFPHLIAGPILHHKDIMPQFQQDRDYGLKSDDLATGLSWFTMGMGKKVLLADQMAPTVSAIFSTHGMVQPSTAWVGVLTYALQLYFDFSGYSDMALGLARMLSIDFPLNFSSPYKAVNIIDFWQRWHITLTEYIGAYVYSPIQFWISRRRQEKGKKVSRKAQATLNGYLQMVAFPTILTMFIAGIWHGAGSQFLVFGLLHGIFLSINHGWRIFRHEHNIKSIDGKWSLPVKAGSAVLTFVCVIIAQVFFRSASSYEALSMLGRMAFFPSAKIVATPFSGVGLHKPIAWLLAGLIIVWVFPNTQQILARYKPALSLTPSDGKTRLVPIYWQPNGAWALLLGCIFFAALIQMQDPSVFLYFQF
jgi:alginate O-acetyltransferase complex protein AlgI